MRVGSIDLISFTSKYLKIKIISIIMLINIDNNIDINIDNNKDIKKYC